MWICKRVRPRAAYEVVVTMRPISSVKPQTRFLDENFLEFRHSGDKNLNSAFVDGHTASISQQTIYDAMVQDLNSDLWVDDLME